MFAKPVRQVDEDFKAFVRSKSCVICSSDAPDPHHLRTRGAGGSDLTCVPLCREHHEAWHQLGPSMFLASYGVDLWRVNSGLLIEYFSDPAVILKKAAQITAAA